MSFDSDVVPPDSSIVATSEGSARRLESAAAAAFPLGAASKAESERCPARGLPTTKTVRSDAHCVASSCAIAR
jgi:hypothetical protein